MQNAAAVWSFGGMRNQPSRIFNTRFYTVLLILWSDRRCSLLARGDDGQTQSTAHTRTRSRTCAHAHTTQEAREGWRSALCL